MYLSDSDGVELDPSYGDQGLDHMIEMDHDNSPTFNSRKKRSKASNDDVNVHSRLLDSHIKIALSLYKVQQNIYLLDFQRIEVRIVCGDWDIKRKYYGFPNFLQGDAFGFMKLCAFIITELKNLSAASRASSVPPPPPPSAYPTPPPVHYGRG